MSSYYVYIHKTADTDQVFYVGKGHGHRAWESYGRSFYWLNVVKKHGLLVELIKSDLTEEDAYSLEKQTIASYGRFQNGGLLVNMTDGGEGRPGFSWKGQRSGEYNPMYGRSQSDNAKQKISQSKLGKQRPQYVVDQMRQRGLDRPKEAHGMYKRKHTESAKQKMSLAGKGRVKSQTIVLNSETGIFYNGWAEVAQCLGLKLHQLEYQRKKNKFTNYKKT